VEEEDPRMTHVNLAKQSLNVVVVVAAAAVVVLLVVVTGIS